MVCNDWTDITLGNVCNIRRGSSPRPINEYLSDEGMPWVKISDATESNSRYINKTKECIKLVGVSKSVIVNPGSLILSNSGTAGLPKFMGITACIHDGWQVLDNLNGIEIIFLYYELLHIRNRLLHGAYDSTMKNLTLDMVRDASICLPPPFEQRAIARILSSLDDKIELNNRMNKTLEEIAQTLFKRWFVDFEFPDENGNPYRSSGGKMVDSELGLIPEGWRIVSIKECIEDYIGGDWGKDSPIEDFIAPVGCIRGADFPAVQSGTVSNLPLRYVKVSSLLRRRLANEDIVLEISGGTKGRPVGRTVFINQGLITKLDYPITFSNFCRLVRCKKPYGLMVYQYIQMKYSDGEIEQYQLQSTGIANFQFNSFLDNFKIIMPNEQIAYLYSDLAGRLYERLQMNDSYILSQLRDTLLPKLMSGEIRVPFTENVV